MSTCWARPGCESLLTDPGNQQVSLSVNSDPTRQVALGCESSERDDCSQGLHPTQGGS